MKTRGALAVGVRLVVAAVGAICLPACFIAGVAGAANLDHRPVVVEEGKRGRYRWGVTVERDAGKRGGQRPCVGVALLDTRPNSFGLYDESFLRVCSVLGLSKPPNIVSLAAGHGSTKVTAVGISFDPRIKLVRLSLGELGQREIRPKTLNSTQSQIADVRQLGYVGFSSNGPFCLEQVVGYDFAGNELYRGPARSCAE